MPTLVSRKRKPRMLLRTSFVIVLVCIVYGIIIYPMENRGTFGDMFGALTALFSGLAFAGIIYTILLQRQELRLQRKELKLSRIEFSTQNTTLKKQRFDNTFFNLLNYHAGIVSRFYFQTSTKTEGQEGITEIYSNILGNSTNHLYTFRNEFGIDPSKDTNNFEIKELYQFINHLSKIAFFQIPNNYGLYAQSLFLLLKFLDTSNLLDSTEEREFYSTIIKDQMTDFEKVVIMYYCMLPNDFSNKVGTYIKKYKIPNDVNLDYFITKRDLDIFKTE